MSTHTCGYKMNTLIGKNVLYNNELVTIVSDFLVAGNSIELVVANSNGGLLRANILDVLHSGWCTADPVISNPEEFVPDWCRIDGDWLAMDECGDWHAYRCKPIYRSVDGEWVSQGGCTGYNFAENGQYYIKYQHPDPEKSLLSRPK